jgi:hypothetical protein
MLIAKKLYDDVYHKAGIVECDDGSVHIVSRNGRIGQPLACLVWDARKTCKNCGGRSCIRRVTGAVARERLAAINAASEE